MLQLIRREARVLSRAWGTDLTQVEIRFSDRLRTSLGRADLKNERISLAPRLLRNPRLLREVLRHELAHVAARRIARSREPVHGPTWRALLTQVRSLPRVRQRVQGRRPAPVQRTFRHECPVCDFVRLGKRRVPAWRCADCVASGLSGALNITEVTR